MHLPCDLESCSCRSPADRPPAEALVEGCSRARNLVRELEGLLEEAQRARDCFEVRFALALAHNLEDQLTIIETPEERARVGDPRPR